MEIKNINKDIKVFYIQADSFPDGILAAHEKLHSLLPANDSRRVFGISYQGPTVKLFTKLLWKN